MNKGIVAKLVKNEYELTRGDKLGGIHNDKIAVSH